jgi:hypothetical protein
VEWLLDLLALAAVIAAVAFLLRPWRAGCSDCSPAAKGAETKIPLSQLRASARRASGRD